METQDYTDRQIEDAKASLMARLEELGRRFKDAKDKLDIQSHIAAHPMLAVGAAFAVGALIGLGRKDRRRPDGTVKRGVGATTVAALSAIGMRLAKDIGARYFSDAAKSWIDRGSVSPLERRASGDPSIEPFLER